MKPYFFKLLFTYKNLLLADPWSEKFPQNSITTSVALTGATSFYVYMPVFQCAPRNFLWGWGM